MGYLLKALKKFKKNSKQISKYKNLSFLSLKGIKWSKDPSILTEWNI